MHVVAHGRGLDDRALPDEHVVADLEGVEGVHAAVDAGRGAQDGLLRDVAVAADGDGHGGGRGLLLLLILRVWAGGGLLGLLLRKTVEVAADDGVGLDDGLAAKDDVLRAVDEGAAGDFVPGVLGHGQLLFFFDFSSDLLDLWVGR